jgi:hypothetical protein
MSNRDDFSAKTKRVVAARAGWHCSLEGCRKLTVGPSEESSSAITTIGVAAHICGAASGPGSRRYVASMTAEERADIDNAIWLCADHAQLIDRDDATFPTEKLHVMKRDHETWCALTVRSGAEACFGSDLLAVGPDVVFTGDITDISAASWTLKLRHFVAGDVHALVSFIDGFEKAAARDRYVLSDEIGDGRVLSSAPTLSRQSDGYLLICPVAPSVSRVDVQRIGSGTALHPETNDLYVDDRGNIARVSGLDYLPQKIQNSLSMQQGENVFAPHAGVRFFEFYGSFKGTPWLARMMKLDVVRQAAIPLDDGDAKKTPLRCVSRVYGIELLDDTPTADRVPVRVDLDVQGVGRWQRHLSVSLPTREQMNARAQLVEKMKHLR